MMFNVKWFVPFILLGTFFMGCGPDTVFLRPALDTPSQHVANGNRLLKWGKIDDACREFDRAKELDPDYVKAYVGLGVALGNKGDFEAGFKAMSMARQRADSTEDIEIAEQGYEQLQEMKRLKKASERFIP